MAFLLPLKISLFRTANQKNSNELKNPMSPEPFVSRAKALPAKRSEKGYEDENDSTVYRFASFPDPHGGQFRKGCKYISVVTGRGNHSRGGKARIKPAILEYLKKHNYR